MANGVWKIVDDTQVSAWETVAFGSPSTSICQLEAPSVGVAAASTDPPKTVIAANVAIRPTKPSINLCVSVIPDPFILTLNLHESTKRALGGC